MNPRILITAALLAMVLAGPARAVLLPHGSFEECNGDDCISCLWDCSASTNCNWIVAPQDWGIDAYHGVLAGWLGGWCGEDSEINQNSFCINIDYLFHDVITWKWMAFVPEGHTGNVIRASIDGVTVFERELGPEDHNWGEEWRTDVTDQLDPFCGIPDQMFCIEIIPTDGASYFVDYFEAFGLCSWVGTEDRSFSAIKSYYR